MSQHHAPHDEAALRRVARRLLRDAADQDDAIQEMWLASIQGGEEEPRSLGWMVGTLRHRAMQIWDRRARTAASTPDEWLEADMPGPDEVMDREMLRDVLMDSIEALPPGQAEIVRGRFFEGLSIEELSRRTGRPTSTVRTRLSRGLAALKERLDGRTGDPRLTALALIRGFDWTREAVLAKGAATSAVGLGGWAALVAVALGVVGVVVARLLGDGGEPATPDVDVAVGGGTGSAPPDGSDVGLPVPDPAAPGRAEATEPVEDAPAGAAAEAATPDAPDTTVDAPPPDGAMVVTFVAVDDAGVPVPGLLGVARNPSDPAAPLQGPSGADGRLRLVATADNFWRFSWGPSDSESLRTMLEGREGEQVRFVLRHPRAVVPAEIHVPFVAGGKREIELRLDMDPARITGRVLNRSGAPVADVKVDAQSQRDETIGDLWYFHQSRKATTDADGRFELPALARGPYVVEVSAPGYVRTTGRALAADDGAPLELRVDRAVAVRGVVRDEAGNPVPHARVHGDSEKQSVEQWAVADEDGAYVYDRLPPGIHRLWAYGSATSGDAPLVDSATLSLIDGEVVWDPVLTTPRQVIVRVLDHEGKPVPDQPVLFLPDGDPGPTPWWDAATTDAEGIARVIKVPDTDLRLELRGGEIGSGGRLAPAAFFARTGIRARDEPYEIQLGPDDRRFASVRGTFVQADGSPCDDAHVSILGTLSKIPGLTGRPSGSFSFEGLPPGRTALFVELPFGGYGSKIVELAPDQELDLGVVRLPEPGTLRIDNTWPEADSEGRPVGTLLAVTVPGVHGPQNLLNESVNRPLKGDFQVLPGTVLLYVTVAGMEIQSKEVEVRSGEVTEVELGPGR